MSIPYWLPDAVFYQIFPDRFANGTPANDPPNVQKWGTQPTFWSFNGGDLRGIIQRFDYLLELGINAIYLNPIFASASNHRYNTTDYFKIDPRLGDMLDFHALIDIAHRNNIRIILDGVFNHCGRGFFAFNDLLENNEHSAYKNWFHVHHFPLDAFTPGEASNYSGWWNHKSMPKFNTKNPDTRNYLLDVGRYWVERGADGWRLDVPNEIDDDNFWAEFRHGVKTANRDACIIGEIWDIAPRWLDDKHFDSLMHYPVRGSLINCLMERESLAAFADHIDHYLKVYPRENTQAMYLLLGSHDTERIFTSLGNNMAKVKLAFLFQFAYPGAPSIYYGDEIGLEGGKDPECRRTFPWEPSKWKGDLHDWVRELVNLRKMRPSLRRGEFSRLLVDGDKGIYSFARLLGDEKTLAVFNFSGQKRDIQIPVKTLNWQDGRVVRSLSDYRPHEIEQGKLFITLAPWSGSMVG